MKKRFKVTKEYKLTLENANALTSTNNYIALYNNNKQVGIFINGEKTYDYIMNNRDDLTGKLKVKILKSKKR